MSTARPPLRTPRIPKLCRHKATGQGYVRVEGKDHYLGLFEQPQTKQNYHRLIAEWLAGGSRFAPPADEITVSEVIDRFWQHAQVYYRSAGGELTGEVEALRLALRPLRQLYGDAKASQFGPLALKAVRQRMVDIGWCRNVVNRMTGRVKHVFRWAVENELLQGSAYHALQAVVGLKRGRCAARDTLPVRPVPMEWVDALKPYVSRQVWAIIQLQLLTGARPGEILIMRRCDIDRTGKIWLYNPDRHKSAYHGYDRTIYIGPRAQQVLAPFLLRPPEAYCFSPRQANQEWLDQRHELRKTPPTYGNRRGLHSVKKPRRPPGEVYTVTGYRRCIARACDAILVPPPPLGRADDESHRQWRQRLTAEQKGQVKAWQKAHRWHPHQLRHNAGTFLRKEFGLEAARIILGHRSAAVTTIYAEADVQKALDVMAKVG